MDKYRDNKAVKNGYKILDIYDAWISNNKSNKLFRGYFSDLMKIK